MFSQRGERRRCYAIVRRAGASHLLLGHSDWLVEVNGGPEVEVVPLWTVCQAQSCTRAGRAGTERSQDERGSALYQQPCCCRYIRSTFAGHAMGLQHPSWYSVLQAYPWKGGVHPCVPFVLLLRQEPCCREVFDLQADLQSSRALVPVGSPHTKISAIGACTSRPLLPKVHTL